MKEYTIVSYVTDVDFTSFDSEVRATYKTLEEARKNFPTMEELKEEMRREDQNGGRAHRHDDDTIFGYEICEETYDNEGDLMGEDDIDEIQMSFAEARKED